jgi:hypothetical protein
MTSDKENNQQHRIATGNEENSGSERKEQFNELSELSLEERIAVADQIGILVKSVGDAGATGAMSGDDEEGLDDGIKGENTGEEMDR